MSIESLAWARVTVIEGDAEADGAKEVRKELEATS
jgi:hypothetical protein